MAQEQLVQVGVARSWDQITLPTSAILALIILESIRAIRGYSHSFLPFFSQQVHDICTKDSDCVAGLQCISCSSVGDMNYRCTRTKTTDPSLQASFSTLKDSD